ncbi:MMPL family transporter [Aeromicrobium sp. CTD01-1L150]|uniref:MMPL family transporter n=1 Tax=Aeromicrobium sp. CTD01-1L150 TaxID=3341830 RepID=UPI0035C236D9
MSTLLYALGRWSFRHHRRVVAAWLLAAFTAGALAAVFNVGTNDTFEIPGTESQTAIDALDRTFPQLAGTSAYLVVEAPGGQSVTSPAARSLIEDAVAEMEQVEGVDDVVSPYSDLTDIGISDDDRAAQVQVQFTGQLHDITEDQLDALQATGDDLDAAGYTTAFGGDAFTDTGVHLSIVELIGVIIAFIVLYLMFRSLRAAVMPIITAIIGVAVTMGLTFALTSVFTISSASPLLALMIGLAVGIDYALFIVSRYRELLAAGVNTDEAAGRAVATAGSAVVFAGVTVMIALTGLAIARIPFLTVMGVIAAFAVAIAVAVAVTLLPALLGGAGERLRPTDKERPPGAFSSQWVKATTRYPILAIVVIIVGLGVLAIPTKDLQLALPDNGAAPSDSTQRQAFAMVEDSFGPGYNGPLLVTMDLITSTNPLGVVEAIEADLRDVPGVEAIGLATPNETGDTGLVQVVPSSGPSTTETADLVHEIRDRAPGWESEHDIQDVSVTGLTAGGIDVSERLQDALLPFGIVVVGLSVLLLMIVFRSLLVPVKATLGFLLSTGAAFGAVVAVFQWGWFADELQVLQVGPLISFLPIVLMAVLFGLSMDYEVFLMSRIKEEYTRTDDPDEAILTGFVGSSRVVTAAAVIMLAVFAAFVPEGDANIQAIAFALAIGVFCDAFLVRMLFAPAVMRLTGRTAWALPRWLDRRLPHIDVEGDAMHRRIALEAWPARPAAISAAGLTAATPQGPIYNDVNLDVPDGDWLVVHGPARGGKTALLLTLAGRMKFDDGRLRVAGHLLPQESRAVRHLVSLGETAGVNELDDALTVDEHIAERLSIGSFGLWVSRSRVQPVRHELNRALQHAYDQAGLPFQEVAGTTPVVELSGVSRVTLGVVLALTEDPRIVVVDDVDHLRVAGDVQLVWSAFAWLLEERGTTLVASVRSSESAPAVDGPLHPERLHLVELDTHRTLSELMS